MESFNVCGTNYNNPEVGEIIGMRKNIILSVVNVKQGSYEYRYTNFEVIGLARFKIKLEFTVPDVDAFTTWPSEL